MVIQCGFWRRHMDRFRIALAWSAFLGLLVGTVAGWLLLT